MTEPMSHSEGPNVSPSSRDNDKRKAVRIVNGREYVVTEVPAEDPETVKARDGVRDDGPGYGTRPASGLANPETGGQAKRRRVL